MTSRISANSKQSTGCIRLDINLLKPSRIEFQAPDSAPLLALPYGHPSSASPHWLEYVYRTSHPVLRWLPTKLAEWIGENLQEALGFPDKADRRARPGTGWTPDELNHILQQHVVDGALTTFGCVEWESELFRGVMSARCYPFKMPNRRFHGFNPQDTIVVVPLYPYCIEDDPNDVPFEDCWYARPQLYFSCLLRPAGGRPPKNSSAQMTSCSIWSSSAPLRN